jgi:hypothetical protein
MNLPEPWLRIGNYTEPARGTLRAQRTIIQLDGVEHSNTCSTPLKGVSAKGNHFHLNLGSQTQTLHIINEVPTLHHVSWYKNMTPTEVETEARDIATNWIDGNYSIDLAYRLSLLPDDVSAWVRHRIRYDTGPIGEQTELRVKTSHQCESTTEQAGWTRKDRIESSLTLGFAESAPEPIPVTKSADFDVVAPSGTPVPQSWEVLQPTNSILKYASVLPLETHAGLLRKSCWQVSVWDDRSDICFTRLGIIYVAETWQAHAGIGSNAQCVVKNCPSADIAEVLGLRWINENRPHKWADAVDGIPIVEVRHVKTSSWNSWRAQIAQKSKIAAQY